MVIPAVLPFGWSGVIDVAPEHGSPEPLQVAQQLESALNEESPRALVREGAKLEFRGGMSVFAWNWSVLVPITRGSIRVDPVATSLRVSYRIYFT